MNSLMIPRSDTYQSRLKIGWSPRYYPRQFLIGGGIQAVDSKAQTYIKLLDYLKNFYKAFIITSDMDIFFHIYYK